jgi:hypothetical protein
MKKAPGRPNLGKTETIKQRALTVYLPTEEMLKKWKTEAERYGVPLSRYVVEVVDDAVRKNPQGMTPREQLEQDLEKIRVDYKLALARLKALEETLEERDTTVAEYRSRLTKSEDLHLEDIRLMFGPVSDYLRENGALKMNDVYEVFHFSPSNSKSLRSVKASIGLLKRMHLVEEGVDDWRWTGGASRKGRRAGRK